MEPTYEYYYNRIRIFDLRQLVSTLPLELLSVTVTRLVNFITPDRAHFRQLRVRYPVALRKRDNCAMFKGQGVKKRLGWPDGRTLPAHYCLAREAAELAREGAWLTINFFSSRARLPGNPSLPDLAGQYSYVGID